MTPQTKEMPLPEFDLSAYKSLYLREARSTLTTLQQFLTRLRDEPKDFKALQQASRAAHTLKGMSATMRYEALATLARTMEEPLFQADQTGQSLDLDQINALLAGCAEFEAELNRLAASDEAERKEQKRG
jgi:two-component system chemotaxis sensor kinase CheA